MENKAGWCLAQKKYRKMIDNELSLNSLNSVYMNIGSSTFTIILFATVMPRYYRLIFISGLLSFGSNLYGQTTLSKAYPAIIPRDSVAMPTWTPHPLIKGAGSMMLAGDRAKPGIFVLRAKYPDGLRLPPHTHATELHAVVLQGMLCVGFSTTWDTSKVMKVLPGQFLRFPSGESHFEYTVGETILQISGIGPMQTTFNDSTAKPIIVPIFEHKK
jgi:quercetin dioxygenase-like cupin family protein